MDVSFRAENSIVSDRKAGRQTDRHSLFTGIYILNNDIPPMLMFDGPEKHFPKSRESELRSIKQPLYKLLKGI